MTISFKIKHLDIHQSYFKGKVEFRGDEYTINIQNERRGKVLKLPFKPKVKNEKMLVRLTGPGDIFIEDYLPYRGESEWVEIDSEESRAYTVENPRVVARVDIPAFVFGLL